MQTDSIFRTNSAFDFKTLLKRMAHSCEIQLCVYGGMSAFVYWLAFTRAYGLNEWWTTTQRTIGKISNYDTSAGISYTLAFAALFILYFLALRCAKFESTRRVLATIAATTIVLNLPLLFLYPIDSTDIFDNILRGRLTSVYGLNPYVVFPNAVPSDPFFYYTGWRFFPSAYGPLWELVAGASAFAAGNSILANIFVFKLLSVASYLGIALLVIQILQSIAPERAAYGAVFVLWNPLMLYTTAGNGHNDAVMMLCAVLGFYFLTRQHFTLAVLAQVAGALIKFIPALFIPLMVLAAWNALPDLRARVKFLLVTGIAASALVAISYARFWDGQLLNLDWRWELFTTSFSAWAWLALKIFYDAKFASLLVSRAGYILLGAWMLRELILLWKARAEKINPEEYIRAALSILLFYLLVTITWFQTWYVVWLIPLAALLPDGFVTRGILLFCGAALWKMPLYDFVLFRNVRPIPAQWLRELWITLGVMLAPWLYFGWGVMRRLRAARMKHIRQRVRQADLHRLEAEP